jgi:hypothetical protein
MSDKDHRPRGALAPRLAIMAVVLLPIAYVLSIGPASHLMGRLNPTDHHETMEFIVWFYRPLTFLCEHFDALQRVMDWYQSLWR